MKFGKKIHNESIKFPPIFQRHFINYKKWKKTIKEYKKNMETKSLEMQIYRTSTIIRLLIKDIEIIDNVFKSAVRLEYSCFTKLFSIFKNDYLINEKYAYEFALLNAEAIRKICKRIDKAINKHTFTPWLIKCRENHRYSFLGGRDLTYLSMKYNEKEKECPICMEETNNLIILNCGHYLCDNCTTKINTSKTLNIKNTCPFCKCNNAFINLVNLNNV